ncbi:uncharacterized protein B0I36DRAFT_352603 [Microdochium trichocladiopsis]|uniref:DUF7907 domain-containing protein n=1 Tax=Microdochium trichocladiopsis TaxID=1682393 RepID=A0A9P8XWY3_9PEZI|nr:uncharacterized protein B0I36DRAFT_352603 [Microdochium trichocladiopsis]KAH7024361.1 hypothetical protein B0I36DRAFT_352603 [Microdochium trichocladiopsis]
MQFTISSIVMAGLASVAMAAPTPDTPTTGGDGAPGSFFLVVQSKDNHVNGCAVSYHTGAGLSDATIADCGPAPPKDFTFVNNKINYLNYGDDIPSAVNAQNGLSSYDNWGSVVINAGDAGSNFTYDLATGFLQQENGLGFLACGWAHNGTWQLFALSSQDAPILPNCEAVTVKRGCYNFDPNCVNNTF